MLKKISADPAIRTDLIEKNFADDAYLSSEDYPHIDRCMSFWLLVQKSLMNNNHFISAIPRLPGYRRCILNGVELSSAALTVVRHFIRAFIG